ncbi:uncharacterized protein FA14DRAFT_160818 [Meira miltonrushii]|uniref:Uncharacterized protein n=1 Tax=Meira miltonrushii TaxID=1280837 RepID=A0A316VE44_9BASI|nr:uncharacterized protein FA14DRAFT_160818 [Meira miltonrushii]PWN35826.1 hypothetical protein FA14DRAFT_160818 [Meira miltonrushii]
MSAIQARYYDNFLCQSLVRAIITSSYLLERGLTHLHSIYQALIDSLGITTDTPTIISTNRAWWDPQKGSAIVVWAGGEQDIAQQLSLALASVRQRKNLNSFERWRKVGYAPYTVIVLMPENSNHLPALIGAWAKRKAEVANSINSPKDDKTKHTFSNDSEYSQKGSTVASTLETFGLGRIASLFGLSDDQPIELQEDESEVYDKQSPSRSSKRRLSIGGWTASDVVGYGRDMLKGLRIGETEQTGIGAVIPVVVDTSTPSGLQHAQSTVQAYCVSHDLLLRALVLIPSIMQQPKQTIVRQKLPQRKPKATSPSFHTTHEKLNQLAKSTEKTLGTDIGETLNLLATLLPIVRSDGGRIIGLVPSAARIPVPREPREVGINDDVQAPKAQTATSDEMQYNITRTALLTMWNEVRETLQAEGVVTSLVHMMPYPASHQTSHQQISNKNLLGFGQIVHHNSFVLRVLGNLFSIIKEEAQQASQSILLISLASLYGIPPPVKPSSAQQPIYPGLAGWQQEVSQDKYAYSHNSSKINIELQECPKLLLDTMKSALVRTCPRKDYSVGLGPHIESIWKYVPGHSIIDGVLMDLMQSLPVD